MSKLYLNVFILCFSCFNGFAQQNETKNLFLMAGVNIMPLSINKGFSAVANYSIQAGGNRFPLKGILRFGFPNYSVKINSYHLTHYAINGNYFMPGAMFYFGNTQTERDVFFIGLMGYVGKYNHSLKLNVKDTTWNTSQSYDFNGKEKIIGFVFEMGGLFTIYKKLKGTGTINTGFVKYSDNPIPTISGFKQVSNFLPGGGRDYNFLIGISIGLQYQIF